LVDFLGNIAGRNVLDVGCGPGTLGIAMSEMGANVTAVDSSESMLRLAREEAEVRGVSIEFVQGTIKDWTMGGIARVFDIVMAINVLRYLENPSDLMELVDRSLTENGRFILSDVHPIIDAGGKPGELAERRVSHYFDRTQGTMEFRNAGEKAVVRFYRRPFEDVFKALYDACFTVTRFAEPQPREALVTDGNRKYFEAGKRFPFCYVLEAVRRWGNNS
jgi:2-polyprenyl-3-methyl-5-hydroxy-6-metoxy-1,4-benzoquinol methylase